MSAAQPCVALLSQSLDMRYLVPAFEAACPGIDWRLRDDLRNVADIDAAVCWQPPQGLLSTLPNLQLIQSIGAGVDHIYADAALPEHVPVCRAVDTDMTAGMIAYVAWAVINRHRHFPDYVANSAQGVWRESPIVPPGEHRVGVAGLGRLGMAVAQALAALGYAVHGWSRSSKDHLPAGVTGHHGAAALTDFLQGIDTLVCLLPLTDETRGFLNAALFAHLPRGSHLINVGRGAHLVEADLLAALASGQLAAATLDTTHVEPLPTNHAFWRDPRILVTPHIATRTSATAVARQTLANLNIVRAGQMPDTRTTRANGY